MNTPISPSKCACVRFLWPFWMLHFRIFCAANEEEGIQAKRQAAVKVLHRCEWIASNAIWKIQELMSAKVTSLSQLNHYVWKRVIYTRLFILNYSSEHRNIGLLVQTSIFNELRCITVDFYSILPSFARINLDCLAIRANPVVEYFP